MTGHNFSEVFLSAPTAFCGVSDAELLFCNHNEQLAMDSLLYLGAGADDDNDDDDDDDDDDKEEEPQMQEEMEKKKPDSLVGSGSLDFWQWALQLDTVRQQICARPPPTSY